MPLFFGPGDLAVLHPVPAPHPGGGTGIASVAARCRTSVPDAFHASLRCIFFTFQIFSKRGPTQFGRNHYGREGATIPIAKPLPDLHAWHEVPGCRLLTERLRLAERLLA